jgi:GxxExxY protein
MEVSNSLGAGFLEKVYRRALTEELRLRGVLVEEEVRYRVMYKERCVGEYVADLVVSAAVVVELKCSECIAGEHVAQAINYLKASGLGVGLILNFERSKLAWKRVVL